MWNKDTFGNVHLKVKDLTDNLIETQTQRNGTNENLCKEKKCLVGAGESFDH